jgi:N-carbamoylputrescine amidase
MRITGRYIEGSRAAGPTTAAQSEGPSHRGPKVGFVEWPDGLLASDHAWSGIAAEISAASLDLLVTNELPFGRWLATGDRFDEAAARASRQDHESGIAALLSLDVPTIISSRPVERDGRLANEAILLRGDELTPVRRKRHLMDEPGWREKAWYLPGCGTCPMVEAGGLRIGILLGAELMFNEYARDLGNRGADLIALLLATPLSRAWTTAAAMAAFASGSYVVGSNRSGGSLLGTAFAGGGYAYSPSGLLLEQTNAREWLKIVRIDHARVMRQKRRFPCSILESEESRRAPHMDSAPLRFA